MAIFVGYIDGHSRQIFLWTVWILAGSVINSQGRVIGRVFCHNARKFVSLQDQREGAARTVDISANGAYHLQNTFLRARFDMSSASLTETIS